MMSKVDLVAISVMTPKIDNGCSLEKEFTKLIRLSPLNGIIRKCQSYLFISFDCAVL